MFQEPTIESLKKLSKDIDNENIINVNKSHIVPKKLKVNFAEKNTEKIIEKMSSTSDDIKVNNPEPKVDVAGDVEANVLEQAPNVKTHLVKSSIYEIGGVKVSLHTIILLIVLLIIGVGIWYLSKSREKKKHNEEDE